MDSNSAVLRASLTGKFAADRVKPAQVLARLGQLGAVQVAAPNALFPSWEEVRSVRIQGHRAAFFGPVWPVCCLARRGSVWHGPLPVDGVRRP